jgi:hypothetical protein
MFRSVFWVVLPCKMIVDNHFTRQYNPEDSSEHHTRRRENLKSHNWDIITTGFSRVNDHWYWSVVSTKWKAYLCVRCLWGWVSGVEPSIRATEVDPSLPVDKSHQNPGWWVTVVTRCIVGILEATRQDLYSECRDMTFITTDNRSFEMRNSCKKNGTTWRKSVSEVIRST